MEEICNRCVHKVICEMGASPRYVSVITGCYNFREERPQTNADRIRSMTDEELAEVLEGIRYNWNCPMREKNGSRRCHEYKDDCVQCWLDWLKQEAKE